MIRELDIPAGVLAYSNDESCVTIEYFRGRGVSVEVPETINDLPVTIIKKKAFFGAKALRRVVIPASVDQIGEWAFASCSGLEEIVISNKNAQLGANIFKSCSKLSRIYTGIYEVTDKNNEQIAMLLALAAALGGTGHLLDLKRAGEADWIEELDSQLMLLLGKDDAEGFSKMLLCGEEDYVGDDSNLEVYCSLRKKEKLGFIFTRLINAYHMGEAAKKAFSEYLRECMPRETWQLVLEEHGEDSEYFDLLIKYDCINANNIAGLIEGMGDKYSGMKAYLLRKKSDMSSGNDFFDDLDI